MSWKCFLHYLPFVKGNHLSPVLLPTKGPVMLSFDVFVFHSLSKLFKNSSWVAGNFRPLNAHVMSMWWLSITDTQIAKFLGPTWGPPGSCRPQVGPMLAPWTLLLGYISSTSVAMKLYHWRPRVVMMPTLSELVALEVVITTASATRLSINTFIFHTKCRIIWYFTMVSHCNVYFSKHYICWNKHFNGSPLYKPENNDISMSIFPSWNSVYVWGTLWPSFSLCTIVNLHYVLTLWIYATPRILFL